MIVNGFSLASDRWKQGMSYDGVWVGKGMWDCYLGAERKRERSENAAVIFLPPSSQLGSRPNSAAGVARRGSSGVSRVENQALRGETMASRMTTV